MKFKHAILLLCVGAYAACGGGGDKDVAGGKGGKGGSASGGSGGSGGKGGNSTGGKGGSASGGAPGSAGSPAGGVGGSPMGSGGAPVGSGGTPDVGGDLKTGLIGYWPFEDGAGTTVKDMSGLGNDGVAVQGVIASSPANPAPMWVAGRVGKAMAFGGINDWVRVPRSDSIDTTGPSGSVTIGAWVNLNQYQQAAANSQFNLILNRHEVGTGYEHFGLGVKQGKPIANVHFFFTEAAEVVKVKDWTYLAMSYDGITESIYVDGVLANSADIGWSIAADTTDVTIGGAQNTDVIKEFIDGTIDEVRLYNRALSAAEVMAAMNLK